MVALDVKSEHHQDKSLNFVPIHPVYFEIFLRISDNFDLLVVLEEKLGSPESVGLIVWEPANHLYNIS